MPLSAAHPLVLQQLPDGAGLFRIRREGSNEVMWTGPADDGLRMHIERLARRVRLREPPASDDELANRLWEEMQRTGRDFQVSAARDTSVLKR